MISSPVMNEFCWKLSSQSTVRPAAAYGDVLTAAGSAHSKGSYVEIFTGAEISTDVWGIWLNLNSADVTGSARTHLTDIAIDPAGGTSYTVKIANLFTAGATDLTVGNGHYYWFPLFIPAGSSIAAATQCSTASGTIRVWAKVYGKPSHPELTRVGTKVTTYGADTGTSAGTAITPGTTNDGAYVTLATPTAKNWFWQFNIGSGDTSQSVTLYWADLAYGAAGSEKLIIEDKPYWHYTTAEESGGELDNPFECYRTVQAGTIVRARAQCSGTADSTFTAVAYGLSG
jgi:hypothetical protein